MRGGSIRPRSPAPCSTIAAADQSPDCARQKMRAAWPGEMPGVRFIIAQACPSFPSSMAMSNRRRYTSGWRLPACWISSARAAARSPISSSRSARARNNSPRAESPGGGGSCTSNSRCISAVIAGRRAGVRAIIPARVAGSLPAHRSAGRPAAAGVMVPAASGSPPSSRDTVTRPTDPVRATGGPEGVRVWAGSGVAPCCGRGSPGRQPDASRAGGVPPDSQSLADSGACAAAGAAAIAASASAMMDRRGFRLNRHPPA